MAESLCLLAGEVIRAFLLKVYSVLGLCGLFSLLGLVMLFNGWVFWDGFPLVGSCGFPNCLMDYVFRG